VLVRETKTEQVFGAQRGGTERVLRDRVLQWKDPPGGKWVGTQLKPRWVEVRERKNGQALASLVEVTNAPCSRDPGVRKRGHNRAGVASIREEN